MKTTDLEEPRGGGQLGQKSRVSKTSGAGDHHWFGAKNQPCHVVEDKYEKEEEDDVLEGLSLEGVCAFCGEE